MSGTLQVGNIIGPTSGTDANKVIIPSGQTLDASNGFVAPAGHVIQVKNFYDASRPSSTSNSFVDSGVSTSFDQELQASSKVFIHVNWSIGHEYDGTWARLFHLTVYEGGINRGDSSYGIGGGAANLAGNQNQAQVQYDAERLSGSALFTPSTTNPTMSLYYKGHDSVGFRLGGPYNNGDALYTAPTNGFIMEIAQ